ncbi:hypothetical protein [Psychrobium sp. 1_MG-2023]|uniref:hypothetical protein n=1 Tax=Psychrobium sp. 1_MG-2023 TaxID=3062624 RepID=UPI000C32207C|nr:hypothetical protein [Psychrobium sp. 1_MG-2023]MDP2562594.1 hypothetical protein [Psychrobium sp. 1_MG-2023]PKF59641.1 hypothetical protein CW748_00055 [Alteromonadales bacterium alter-6D02]
MDNEQATNKKQQCASKPKSNSMGLAIAMGAGIGLVFGEALFGSVSLGLVIGAGTGVVYGSMSRPKG